MKKTFLINYNEEVISIKRAIDFTEDDKELIAEILKCLSRFENIILRDYYKDDIIAKSIEMAIFQHVFKQGSTDSEYALRVFDLISNWISKTYVNRQVCFGIQFTAQIPDSDRVNLLSVLNTDYVVPIADGVSTFLTIDFIGGVTGISTHKEEDESANIPIKFTGISKVADDIFLILTTRGNFLIIKDGEMRFAKKGKYWIRYNQSSFEKIFVESLAVYQTCLDVSFAKTGGLLTIVKKTKGFAISKIVDQSIINNGHYELKQKFIKNLINRRKFHEITRYERKELLAMDGSMIIGGRAAAATELSAFGTSIKVSSDGYMQIY